MTYLELDDITVFVSPYYTGIIMKLPHPDSRESPLAIAMLLMPNLET